MAVPLGYRLCLGDVIVPLKTETLDFKDLFELKDGDQDQQEFLTLNLKATSNMEWLTKMLDLKKPWWPQHSQSLPLLHEIETLINSKRPKSPRMPRNPKAIVAIEVRGRTVLVQNIVSSVILAFKSGDEIADIHWFIREIEKDLEDEAMEPATK